MCTLSIHRTAQALLVTMNRDEARTRGPEIPPAIWGGPVAMLAPRDSDQGGTWMAINEDGVTACLLNKYENQTQADTSSNESQRRSRGFVIPEVLSRGSITACLDFMRECFDPRPYSPFTLVLADMDRVTSFTWSGSGMEVINHPDPWTMLSSSFFDTEEVLDWRREAFASWLRDGAILRDGVPLFNLHQPPRFEEWAPLMERDVSATRSITQTCVKRVATEWVLRWGPVANKSVAMTRYTLALPAGHGAHLS